MMFESVIFCITFRSGFKSWNSEPTYYQNDFSRNGTGNTIKNKVEAGYIQGDLLERRRVMMDDWINFINLR